MSEYDDDNGRDGREQKARTYRDAVLREFDMVHQDIARINRKLDSVVLNELSAIKAKLAVLDPEKLVSKEEFRPIYRLVWTVVTTVVGLVVTAILGLIAKSGKWPPL